MVMGDDSFLRGHGFESLHRITGWTWHFSHWFAVKIVLFVRKDQKKLKRGWNLPIFLKKEQTPLKTCVQTKRYKTIRCCQIVHRLEKQRMGKQNGRYLSTIEAALCLNLRKNIKCLHQNSSSGVENIKIGILKWCIFVVKLLQTIF